MQSSVLPGFITLFYENSFRVPYDVVLLKWTGWYACITEVLNSIILLFRFNNLNYTWFILGSDNIWF